MKRFKAHWILIVAGTLLIAVSLVAGLNSPTLAQDPAETPDPLGEEPSFLVGYYNAWVESPHADFASEAFVHWDEDGEISERCAACHSTFGYLDFVGADGTEAGVVDAPAALGSVVNCDACHNPVAANLTEVTFPSGLMVEDIGDSTRCMVCHQGRSSGLTVVAAIEEAGAAENPDMVNEELRFINQHYYAAAATLYGSEVHGGFQYDGQTYQMKFNHVEGFDTCDDCHSPHTLEVRVSTCVACHEGVEDVSDLEDIRMAGSLIDYDGDGDMEEGIKGELDTLADMLYAEILAYSGEVVGTQVVYGAGYPYFFTDLNGNGEADEDEQQYGNQYAQYTPRLLQAVYNYQVSQKDPGAYAHNPKYHIELLYDSIMSLREGRGMMMGDDGLHRDDPGHFDASSRSFRHWDEDGEVPGRCSKCHTAEGIPFFAEHGVSIAMEPSDELSCSTCHSNVAGGDFSAFYTFNEVEMPSGAVASFGEEEADNVCLNCHQGRDSGVGIAAAIEGAGVGDDEVSEALRFRNPHYFASGAQQFGADANGAYEYEGMEYSGFYEHVRRFDTCSGCHDVHALEVRAEECIDCHENLDEDNPDLLTIRFDDDFDPVDYDGDGDVTEGIAMEIQSYQDALFESIITYAAETIGTPIGKGGGYPYWFIDTNGDGVIDGEEGQYGNSYATWTPTLLRGIYNYMFFLYTPGNYAHNPDYTLQVLYDTIADIGGEEAVAGFNRAPVLEME